MNLLRAFVSRRGSHAAVLLGLGWLCASLGCAAPPPSRERAVQLPPVRTEVVHAGPHTAQLTILGVVRPAETVSLEATQGGKVSYPARFAAGLRTGAQVSAGETIATFDNDKVRLDLAEARLAAESAEAELTRKRGSYDAGIISESEFTEAEIKDKLARERLTSAERKTAELELKAPRSGRLVVTRSFPPGMDVSAGSALADLAAGGAPKVEGWAAGSDLESLRPGLHVAFLTPRGEAAGEGEIREVASVLDESGTARVVASVSDSRGLPPSGEGVEMRVDLEHSQAVITVPEEAVMMGMDGSSVFLAESAGAVWTAKMTAVALGRRGGGRVEVRSGLSEGDRVIVAGVSLVGDGMLVREVSEEADGSPASKPPPAEKTVR